MQKDEILKGFGQRIRELRKQKGWTQKELAAKLDMQFPQLNKYECGLNNPPLKKLILLADTLNTTIDYLLTGNYTDESPLHNIRLLKRFKELQSVNVKDQETILDILDAMIIKNRMEGAMTPLDNGSM